MLQIIKYYKTIFLWFIQNNFAELVSGTPFLDEFSTSKDKGTFLKDNVDKLISYLKTLDSDKGGKLSLLDDDIRHYIVSHDNPKLKELFDKIGIKDGQLMSWIDIKEIVDKLKEYKKKKESVEINLNLLNKTLRLTKPYMEGSDVMVLQEFLVREGYLDKKNSKWETNIDQKFGPATMKALKKYQETIYVKNKKNADWILTKNWRTWKEIMKTRRESAYSPDLRQATAEEVRETIDKANISISSFIKMLRNQNDFYRHMEAREDWWYRNDILSHQWSIYGWVREVFWVNKADQYFKNMEGIKSNIEKNKKRFNEWYDYLMKDSSSRNDSLLLYWLRDSLLLILGWLPIIDLRLNFMKNLNDAWVSMTDANLFIEWTKNWMKESFKEFKDTKKWKEVNEWTNVFQNINAIKRVIADYFLSKGVEEQDITNDLIRADKKIQELVKTYIEKSLIPDLVNLNEWGFEWMEKASDDKYSVIKELIQSMSWKKVLLKQRANKRWAARWNKNWEKIYSHLEKKVYLEKSWSKYYLKVDSLYKEFDHKPTEDEINTSLKDYKDRSEHKQWNIVDTNRLNHKTGKKYTKAEAKAHNDSIRSAQKWWIALSTTQQRNIDNSDDRVELSPEEEFDISDRILEQLEKQDKEWILWTFNVWRLTSDIGHVKSRNESIQEIDNSLKKALIILEKKDNNLAKTFGILQFFTSVSQFLNAYAIPDDIRKKIKWLISVENNPEQFIKKLNEISKDNNAKAFFESLSLGKKREQFRLNEINERVRKRNERVKRKQVKWNIPTNDPDYTYMVDAGKYKYWVRMLTRDEFSLPFEKLQKVYEDRFNAMEARAEKIKDPRKKVEFKKWYRKEFSKDNNRDWKVTFEDVYKFSKPKTYEEYIDLLVGKTWAILTPETDKIHAKGFRVIDSQERWLVEQGVYDITWADLQEAFKVKSVMDKEGNYTGWTRARDINDLIKDPTIFDNTARQEWNAHDVLTTFEKLRDERWDIHVFQTQITKKYQMYKKDWSTFEQSVTYNIFTRPECENVYILPSTQTVSEIKQKGATFDMSKTMLTTPSFPVLLFNKLNIFGNWTNWTKLIPWSSTQATVWNTVPNNPWVWWAF